MSRTATKKAAPPAPARAKDAGWATDAVHEHVAIHRPSGAGWWSVLRWSAQHGSWRPVAGAQDLPILNALEAVKGAISFGHVTVADYALDIAGLDLKEMDTVSPGRPVTFFCPEGNPDNPDLWTSLDISAGRAAGMSSISPYTRFVRSQLEERFRAALVPDGNREPSSPPTHQTYAVRRTFTARCILPQENWGIVGNPELLAKQQAESEARTREETARDEESDGWNTPRVISATRR